MSARDDWRAGLPRPVVFSAQFDKRELAVAFSERLEHDDPEEDVEESTCECCSKVFFQVGALVEIARRDLARAYASWSYYARQAGGEPYDDVVVFFDEPDLEHIDPRSRALRRHGGRRHRRHGRRP